MSSLQTVPEVSSADTISSLREKVTKDETVTVGGASLDQPITPEQLVEEKQTTEVGGTVEITTVSHPEALASNFPVWRKWVILTVIFLVQTSMNLNTSLYVNGQKGMAKEFNVSEEMTVSGAAIFLLTYAFGCEL
jgi:hypothetical protein